MLPVLLNLGPVHLSSFGVFLILGFIAGVFFIWRLSKIEEFDEDQITNLSILTFLGSLFGARLGAVLLNLSALNSLSYIFDLNKFPAFSFWGGLVGAVLVVVIYSYYQKRSPWELLDLAAIGGLIGIVFGNLGCFLGGCIVGVPSSSIFAFPVVGLLEKRLPVSLLEAALFLILFLRLWKKAVRYHPTGSLAVKFLLWLGLIKFLTDIYRSDRVFIQSLSVTQLLAATAFLAGLALIYTQQKRDLVKDLRVISGLITNPKKRNSALLQFGKYWYNLKIVWRLRTQRSLKSVVVQIGKLKRRLNVKSTPQEYR